MSEPERTPPEVRRRTVGVRFADSGRTLMCDAGNLDLREDEVVLVEDRRMGALAKVSLPSGQRLVRGPLPRIIRKADADDLARQAANESRATQALAFARERARARGLSIKLFRVDFAPRGERVFFTFASEQRVDFRELVKDLASKYHTRIELRQVGVREEAKLTGGIGSCGRELCCTTFLPRFAPVSIRMAKSQNLALNPAKVSGQCGRLKCCLVYEDATYVELARGLPKVGKQVETPEGTGRVQDLDILRGLVRVHFPDKPPQVFAAGDVRRLGPPSAEPPSTPDPADDGEPGDAAVEQGVPKEPSAE